MNTLSALSHCVSSIRSSMKGTLRVASVHLCNDADDMHSEAVTTQPEQGLRIGKVERKTCNRFLFSLLAILAPQRYCLRAPTYQWLE